MDLSNLLNSVLGDEKILQELSRKVNARPEQVRKAATLGVPTLVEAIDRNAKEESRRDSLAKALEDHQNDDVENLEGFISHVDVNEGDRMVGHILGDRKMNVENSIANTTSLGIGQVSGLMSMLAPILIGMLGNKKKEENISRDSIPDLTGSLGGLLGGSGGGGIMDVAKKLLDKDGDGGIMDDLLGKFF